MSKQTTFKDIVEQAISTSEGDQVGEDVQDFGKDLLGFEAKHEEKSFQKKIGDQVNNIQGVAETTQNIVEAEVSARETDTVEQVVGALKGIMEENIPEGDVDGAMAMLDVVKDAGQGGEDKLSLQGVVDIGVMLMPENYQVGASFALNTSFFYLVTEVLGIAVGTAVDWSPTSIVLAQIKAKIENLQKDVDTLLHADMKAAEKHLKQAMNYLEFKQYQRAFEEFVRVRDLSIAAFSQVKTFENKEFCKRLTMFSRLLTDTYDNNTKQFTSLGSVSKEMKQCISLQILDDVSELKTAFDGIEKSFYEKVTFQKESKEKKDNEKFFNGILKNSLPAIWNEADFNNKLKTRLCNDEEILIFIPNGYGYAAKVQLNDIRIKVWKHDNVLMWEPCENLDMSLVFDITQTTTFRCISSSNGKHCH